jgi:hypothetical protein
VIADDGATTRITVQCARPPEVVIVVEVLPARTTIERTISLATIEPDLRVRILALAIAELVGAAGRTPGAEHGAADGGAHAAADVATMLPAPSAMTRARFAGEGAAIGPEAGVGDEPRRQTVMRVLVGGRFHSSDLALGTVGVGAVARRGWMITGVEAEIGAGSRAVTGGAVDVVAPGLGAWVGGEWGRGAATAIAAAVGRASATRVSGRADGAAMEQSFWAPTATLGALVGWEVRFKQRWRYHLMIEGGAAVAGVDAMVIGGAEPIIRGGYVSLTTSLGVEL